MQRMEKEETGLSLEAWTISWECTFLHHYGLYAIKFFHQTYNHEYGP